jgi:hypothetical protein
MRDGVPVRSPSCISSLARATVPFMLKHTVLVQITGATQFQAEVEIDADDLDPDTPPPYLTGTFTRFDGYDSICKALVHTDRFDGGSSHTMYLFDGRHGYRFTMAAPDSERFQAVSLSVNPATGLPGFKGQE